jgi:hypothetical protein
MNKSQRKIFDWLLFIDIKFYFVAEKKQGNKS